MSIRSGWSAAGGGKGGAEEQYVNDRPYVASSLLSVVLSRWFNSALGGRCERKPELAATPLPLEARLAAVPCRAGEGFLRALFEPLGYEVEATRHKLDESMLARVRLPRARQSPAGDTVSLYVARVSRTLERGVARPYKAQLV